MRRVILLLGFSTAGILAQTPLTITSTSPLKSGQRGVFYSFTFTASGGSTPYTWSQPFGTVPPPPPPAGLSLSSTGVLSGTISADAGNYTFPVQVQDRNQTIRQASFTITVTNPPPVTINTGSPLPDATLSSSYSTSISATGGDGSYSWSIVTSGTGCAAPLTGLPPNMTLATATGGPAASANLSGSPSQSGVFRFCVQAFDGNTIAPQAGTKTFVLTVNPRPNITTTTLPNGQVGAAYNQAVIVSGGTPPISWGFSGTLPSGLALNGSTGVISGTPNAAGTFNFTVQVNDVYKASDTQTYTVTIVTPLQINTTSPLAPGFQGTFQTRTFQATGGTSPYNWSISAGTPPPGMTTLDPQTGVLSGTPSQTGTFNFTVQVRDSSTAAPQTVTKNFSITINAGLSFQPTSLPNGTATFAYPTTTFTGTGGTTPYSWSVVGSQPAGLSLNPSSGVLSGTPTLAGDFSFTIRLTDASQTTFDRPFSVNIATAPAISTSSLPDATANTPYNQSVAGSGGTAPYTFAITSGALPGGLSLAAGGAITGTATTVGQSNFTVRLTDARGATASRALSINVVSAGGPLTITTASLLNGTRFNPYSAALNASGGTPAYRWSISGSLPSGLTLNPATGGIGGTPDTVGTFTFTATVNDAVGQAANRQLSITIVVNPTITTTPPLPGGTVGIAYSTTINATGGTPPYAFSILSGSLPPGLSVNPSTGAIAGTPTQAGAFSFTVGITDALGAPNESPQYSIGIVSAPTITTTSLPNGPINAPYPAQTLTATGGTPPYTWSLSGGALPPGLSLSSGGVIAGTATAVGTSNFTVRVTDAANAVATRALSITIVSGPTITTTSLPNGTLAVQYSTPITTVGGTLPYAFSISSGSLPPGLTLNQSTGAITGTPTQAGAFGFAIGVTDALGARGESPQLTITIVNALTITTASLPNGPINAPYPTQTLVAAGGTPPYTWSLSAGALPPGLSLSSGGAITGTATSVGTFNFTIGVTDAANAVATRALSIAIVAGPSITTTSLPNGTPGIAYSTTINAIGGTQPYAFSIMSGSLPQGLTLNPASGAITGTPTQPGPFSFALVVTDSLGARSESRQFTITIANTLTVTTVSLPDGPINASYPTQTLAASGGTPPYTWSLSAGALPPGISLSSAGVISGTATSTGSFSFTIGVTDSSNNAASRGLSITIVPGPAITTTSLPNGVVGVSYSQTLTATGGSPPYSWSISSGTLPAGLSLNASTGILGGTPTTAGSFTFVVQVADTANARSTREFSVTVTSGLTIITDALGNATVGVPYTATLVAAGGRTPLRWTASAPPGLSLNASTGVLSGTPTTQGTFSISVEVSDAAGARATRTLSLAVAAALSIQTVSPLTAGTAGRPYAASLSATGGTEPYTWSTTSGSLPGGVTLAGDGTVTGTPTAVGTFTFTAMVMDATGNRASRSFAITISLPAISNVSVTGLPPTPQPLLQPSLNLAIGTAFPVDLLATANLAFASEVGGEDGTVQFATGGRTTTFTIPAGQLQASSPVGIQTGTVAGVITLSVTLRAAGSDVTPQPAPLFTIRVPRQAPVILNARITRTATGLNFVATGFSTTRDALNAVFTVDPAPGSNLQATSFTLDVSALFRGWFQNATSNATGGQFTFTQPFTIQGDANAVRSMTMTLSNSTAQSQPVTAQVP